MFMALEPLAGLRVVDLFAGSGALGIEALSRGAERADFVDLQPLANRALRSNLTALALDSRARIWTSELPLGLKRLGAVLLEADLVFLDPPYGRTLARDTLEALGVEGTLRPESRVVVEHHAKDLLPEEMGCLTRVRQRRYGETVVSTFRTEARPRGEGR